MQVQNIKGLGKSQRAALEFAQFYTVDSWHTFSQDSKTQRIMQSLQRRGLIEINQFAQFKLLPRFISLTQESIDQIFDTASVQSDYILALYRVAFPEWDNIASVDGHPQISEPTGLYIFERAIAFDKVNHPEIFNGGAWLNQGFTSLDSEDIPDWQILPCEYTLAESSQ